MNDNIKISNYYTHRPASQQKPKNMVILLHGVGSNGQDLISLAPLWEQFIPECVFISPDAPFACDMAPPGYPNSFQWFSLLNRDVDVMLEGVKIIQPILQSFINSQLEEYSLEHSKLALVGFSQGTMTSLHVGPRVNPKIAGMVGYSGALLWEDKMKTEEINRIPIHLIHGQSDDVVSVKAWDFACSTLKECGFNISGHTTPGLYHSIDAAGIQSGGEFLKKIFS